MQRVLKNCLKVKKKSSARFILLSFCVIIVLFLSSQVIFFHENVFVFKLVCVEREFHTILNEIKFPRNKICIFFVSFIPARNQLLIQKCLETTKHRKYVIVVVGPLDNHTKPHILTRVHQIFLNRKKNVFFKQKNVLSLRFFLVLYIWLSLGSNFQLIWLKHCRVRHA